MALTRPYLSPIVWYEGEKDVTTLDTVYRLIERLPETYRGQSASRVFAVQPSVVNSMTVAEIDERLSLHLREHGLLPKLTVYTGAFGYRDCDAIAHLVARSPEELKAALDASIKAEFQQAEQTCEGHEDEDDTCPACSATIWSVGPFEDSLLEVARGIRNDIERRQFLDDLRGASAAYLP